MYHKAWEVSNHRYARAKRSLAKICFNRKDYDNSIIHYKEALDINEYHMESWNQLAFIYMFQKKHDEAIHAYSKVIQIDDTQGLAWANLSNIYLSIGKKTEALAMIEKASKNHERHWKIWMNYASVAFENKKFNKFAKATLKVVDLDKAAALEDASLKRLVIAMN